MSRYRAKPLVFEARPACMDTNGALGYEVVFMNDPLPVANYVYFRASDEYEDMKNLPDEYFNDTPRLEINWTEDHPSVVDLITIDIEDGDYSNTFYFKRIDDSYYFCYMTPEEWEAFKLHSRRCGNRLNKIMREIRKSEAKWTKRKPEVFAV